MNEKSRLTFFIKLIISAALFSWFFFSVDWQEVLASFYRIKLFGVVWAIACIIVAVLISVIKWGLLLKAQGFTVGWLDLWRAYWVGLFFNNFLPSSIGGDGMRIMMVGQKTGDLAGVSLSVVVERILATIGISFIALPALFFTGGFFPGLKVLFLLLSLGSLLILCLLMWGKVPEFIKRRQGKITAFLQVFISHGESLKKQPVVLLKVTLWSAGFQAANVAVNYFIFQGLGLYHISFLDAMVIIPATAVVSMVPVGINSYGIREGAYIALLTPFGVGRADAFTASVLYAFLISLCSLWGGLIWLTNKKKEGTSLVGTESIGNSQGGYEQGL